MLRLCFVLTLAACSTTALQQPVDGGADLSVSYSCGSTSAIDACEAQCAPGLAGGICYPAPACVDGNWKCFCQPCVKPPVCEENEYSACRRQCNCGDLSQYACWFESECLPSGQWSCGCVWRVDLASWG